MSWLNEDFAREERAELRGGHHKPSRHDVAAAVADLRAATGWPLELRRIDGRADRFGLSVTYEVAGEHGPLLRANGAREAVNVVRAYLAGWNAGSTAMWMKFGPTGPRDAEDPPPP